MLFSLSVFGIMTAFKGEALWKFGIEENQVMHAAQKILKHVKESLVNHRNTAANYLIENVANENPLASELHDFLCDNYSGYYSAILARHNIHSIRRLSMLDAKTCRKIAEEASHLSTKVFSSPPNHTFT
jgi:hypothetical protein